MQQDVVFTYLLIFLLQVQASIQSGHHHARDIDKNTSAKDEHNILMEMEIKKLSQKLSHAEAENVKLREQLKSQQELQLQVEVDVRKEVMRDTAESAKLIKELTLENVDLKQQMRESKSCKEELLKEIKATNEICKIQLNHVKSVITSTSLHSETKVIMRIQKVDENVAKVLVKQNQLDVCFSELNKTAAALSAQRTDMLSQFDTGMQEQLEQLKAQRDVISSVQQQLVQENQSEIRTKSVTQETPMNNKTIRELACKIAIELSFNKLNTTILNDKKYYFSYEQPSMTWYDADNFCKSHGLRLVSVDTLQEWNALKPEVLNLKNKVGVWPWSAGSDAVQEGNWKWTTTGRDITFFADQEMDNYNIENCMYLHNTHWYDFTCSGKLSFICENNSVC